MAVVITVAMCLGLGVLKLGLKVKLNLESVAKHISRCLKRANSQ